MFRYLIACNHKAKTHQLRLARFNHYETLKVKRTATSKEIKDSYYKLSKKYHPDVNKEHSAEGKFKEIQAAYHVLGDEMRKIDYDRHGSDEHEHFTDKAAANSPFSNRAGPNFYKTRWKARTAKKQSNGSYTKASAYDFDDFYRMHYGDYLKRRQNEMQYENFVRVKFHQSSSMREKAEKPVKENNQSGEATIQIPFLKTILCLTVVTLFIYNQLERLESTEEQMLHTKAMRLKEQQAEKR